MGGLLEALLTLRFVDTRLKLELLVAEPNSIADLPRISVEWAVGLMPPMTINDRSDPEQETKADCPVGQMPIKLGGHMAQTIFVSKSVSCCSSDLS